MTTLKQLATLFSGFSLYSSPTALRDLVSGKVTLDASPEKTAEIISAMEKYQEAKAFIDSFVKEHHPER